MDLATISVRNVYLRPTVRIFTVYILHVMHADVYGVLHIRKTLILRSTPVRLSSLLLALKSRSSSAMRLPSHAPCLGEPQR